MQCWWLSGHKYRREVLLHRAHYLEGNIGVYSFLCQRILPTKKTRVLTGTIVPGRKLSIRGKGVTPLPRDYPQNISIFPTKRLCCFSLVDG